MRRIADFLILMSCSMTLIACAGATHSERKAKAGSLIGAGAGAVLGQAIAQG